MDDRRDMQIDLVKLVGGERLLRITETRSGMTLEKRISAGEPVHRQKQKLLAVFEAALANVQLAAA